MRASEGGRKAGGGWGRPANTEVKGLEVMGYERLLERRRWALIVAVLLAAAVAALGSAQARAVTIHHARAHSTSEGWSAAVLPAGAQDEEPVGLDCTPGFCMTLMPTGPIANGVGQALTAGLDYSVLSGGSWTEATSTGFSTGNNFATSLSCASSSLCMAIAINGVLEVYNGSGWSAATVPGNTGMNEEGVGQEMFTDVSCAPATTFCMAAMRYNRDNGPGFEYATYENGDWSIQQFPVFLETSGSWGIQQVSCTGDGSCVGLVTDQIGKHGISVYSDGAWGSYVSASQVGIAQTLSCSTTSFCITANAAGGTTLWTFTGSFNQDSSSTGLEGFPRATSCVPGTSVFCVGSYRTPQQEEAYRIDTGSGWVAAPMPISPDAFPAWLSCSGPSFCVIAADSFSSDKFLGFQVWPTAAGNDSASVFSNTTKSELGKAMTVSSAATIQSIAKHGYRFVFDAPVTGKLSLVWTDGKTKIAKLSRLVHPGKIGLKLSLTAAGRRLLVKSKRSVKLRTTATFAVAGIPTVSLSKTLTLKK